MTDNFVSETVREDEDINYDDIPKITNFTGWRRHPFAGTFNGIFNTIIEHDGYKEIVRFDYNKTPPMREVLEIIPNPKDSATQLGERAVV